MAWWQALEFEALYETQGVLVIATVFTLVLLGGGLGIAYLWHRFKDAKPKA